MRKQRPLKMEPATEGTFTPWTRPPQLTRRQRLIIAAVIVAVNAPVIHHFLFRGEMPVKVQVPYSDDFSDVRTVNAHYFSIGGDWRVVDGELLSPGVENNRLWLTAKLPDDVVIEFDARLRNPQGVVKVEVFGNGVDAVSGNNGLGQARGYIVSYRGGQRRAFLLARRDENGATLEAWSREPGGLRGATERGRYRATSAARIEQPAATPLKEGKSRWRIVRIGGLLRVEVNGAEVLAFDDPLPLRGEGNDRFAFSSVEEDVLYDNLSVRPATAADATRTSAPAPAAEPAATFELSPANYLATAPEQSELRAGELTVRGVRNHPVWSRARIPPDAAVELTAWSESPDGDIKFEAWGDGTSHAASFEPVSYTASGYVFILGGWKNSRSIIARGSEHGREVVGREDFRVEPNRKYRLRAERRGKVLQLFVDGQPFLTYEDNAGGIDSGYLGLSGWDTHVHFADVSVRPL